MVPKMVSPPRMPFTNHSTAVLQPAVTVNVVTPPAWTVRASGAMVTPCAHVILTVAVAERLEFVLEVAVTVAVDGHIVLAVNTPVLLFTEPLDAPSVTVQVKAELGKLGANAVKLTFSPTGTLAEPGYMMTVVGGGGGGEVLVELPPPPQAARESRITATIAGRKRSGNLERIKRSLSEGEWPGDRCALFLQCSSQVCPLGIVILLHDSEHKVPRRLRYGRPRLTGMYPTRCRLPRGIRILCGRKSCPGALWEGA
jgi:hypothetical protein